jgi:methionine aminotransferase
MSAAIPISTFYENGKDLHLIRFVSLDNVTLATAASRLCKI